MTDVFSDHFSIVYDICRAACHGDTALGRSSVKKLAGLMESSTPDDAALLKRLTKKAAKDPAHFVQSDGGSSKATISHVGEDAALPAEKVAAEPVETCADGCQYSKDVGMWPEHSCAAKCMYSEASAKPIYQVENVDGDWSDVDWLTYESTEEGARRIVYAAPQQPAQSAEQDERVEAYSRGWDDALRYAAPQEPSTKMLREMAYELQLVPNGEVVCVQFLDVLRKQYKAAFNAARAASPQSTAPQPAQTQVALTDDARECLADVVSHYRALYAGLAFQLNEATVTENADDMAYWKHEIKALERMYAQAERALLAAQPMSGGKS
jgi:hypothetical protein